MLGVATHGAGSGDEQRLRALLRDLDPVVFPFDRSHKAVTALALIRKVRRVRPDVMFLEGTGLAGGLATLVARALLGVPFVLSSGDAVGPYLARRSRWLAPMGAIYEHTLCRCCSGFVGWSPYLVGRALTLGAPRAMTAAHHGLPRASDSAGVVTRRRLGIPANMLLFGIAGSTRWNRHVEYCYGAELVRAIRRTARRDVGVLVVGDGDGLARLRKLAGDDLDQRVFLPGRCERGDVPAFLAAMDIGSLPQSVDRVGALRYTTKLPEYIAAGLPVVTGEIPLGYDLDDGWIWRVPGDAPWAEEYVGALVALMETLTREAAAAASTTIPPTTALFDLERQTNMVGSFVREVVDRERRRRRTRSPTSRGDGAGV